MGNKVYPGIKNSILLSLLLLGIQLGLGVIIGLVATVLKLPNQSTLYWVLLGLVSFISFGVPLLIGFRKTKRSFNEVFKLNKVSPSLWIATIIFMIGFVIVSSELDNLVNYILPMPEMFRSLFDNAMLEQPFIVGIIVIGIIPGFMEEFFFRGLILDGFSRNYSQKKAIIISALLFGFVHLNPWQFYGAFIIGIISAFICLKTNSLWLSIYIHLFNNILSTTVVKYRHLFPIKGFNTDYVTPVVFQPLWFDITGVAILIAGVFLLKKSLGKNNGM